MLLEGTLEVFMELSMDGVQELKAQMEQGSTMMPTSKILLGIWVMIIVKWVGEVQWNPLLHMVVSIPTGCQI